MNKIQNVLNNLNIKILRFNEQKKKIEDEVKKGHKQSLYST